MKPRVSDSVRARSTACMGSFATRYGRPAATASFSLSPTRAIFRIREKTERYQAIARISRATVKVSLDNAEVVLRDVRELRAACALAQSPDAGRGRFEAFVHLDVSTRVQGHAGLVQPDVLRIGNSANGDKDIAPFQKRRSRRGSKGHAHRTPGRAFYLLDLHVQTNIYAIEAEKLEKGFGDIFVLARKQLRSPLQNGDTASKTDECLRA